jgi:hypothetical protein
MEDINMNIRFNPITLLCLLMYSGALLAETNTSMSSSLGIHIYPAKGQSAETQSKDDYECFNWAKGETGHDPMNPQSVEVAVDQSQSGRDGSIVKGAAAGAIIGEVANDDAGKGAAYGAAVGVVKGRRNRKAKAHQAEQQAEAQGQQIEHERQEDFNNAMKACMSGRGYSVS